MLEIGNRAFWSGHSVSFRNMATIRSRPRGFSCVFDVQETAASVMLALPRRPFHGKFHYANLAVFSELCKKVRIVCGAYIVENTELGGAAAQPLYRQSDSLNFLAAAPPEKLKRPSCFPPRPF